MSGYLCPDYYACPNCGDAIVLAFSKRKNKYDVLGLLPDRGDEPPPKIHAFCFECGEWVDFEKEPNR